MHPLQPFCTFQTRIFLEHSAENYGPCLVVTFCYDPFALEFTHLRDLVMLPITTASHINHETFMIITNALHCNKLKIKITKKVAKFDYTNHLPFCILNNPVFVDPCIERGYLGNTAIPVVFARMSHLFNYNTFILHIPPYFKSK